MKKLIYSQEDLDLILSLETQEKDKEIERLNNIIDKAKEYIKKETENINNLIVVSEDFDIEKVLDILKGVDKE